MTTFRTRSLAAALALLCAGAVLACASKPAPAPAARAPIQPPPPPRDGDGTPAEASPLTLGARHSDTIDRARGDLDDWFKIDVTRTGSLTVILEGPSGAALPNLTLAVTDPKGGTLAAPARTGGRPRVGFGPRELVRGTYLIWVGSEAGDAGTVPYEVRSSFAPKAAPAAKPKPAPPPPKPRFETRAVRLVELSAGGQYATIGGGSAQGIAVGMGGRLLSKGAPIAQLRVIEVYEKGSRVQLDPPVVEAPSGAMAVEVDIPLP
jgi:hypothetical protein